MTKSGVTRILVLDNLKPGVTKAFGYDDPILNKTYHEMAEHYETAIIPAIVRKPKDYLQNNLNSSYLCSIRISNLNLMKIIKLLYIGYPLNIQR